MSTHNGHASFDGELAPIALFCFKRPAHLARTLESLKTNALAGASVLYAFCDGPRSAADEAGVAEVRRLVASIEGFAKVDIRHAERNLGLSRSILSGVTEVVERHGRIIVLEDDLALSPHFLTYMNEGLRRYEHEAAVASIHGYLFPTDRELPETFFMRGADCWGWATWARAWSQFEADGSVLLKRLEASREGRAFDLGGAYPYRRMLKDQIAGRNDSWAIRWHASVFLNGGLTLYPGRSLVINIGHDASGTHSKVTDAYDGGLASRAVEVNFIPIRPSKEGEAAAAAFFRRERGGMLRRIGRLIKYGLGV